MGPGVQLNGGITFVVQGTEFRAFTLSYIPAFLLVLNFETGSHEIVKLPQLGLNSISSSLSLPE